MLQEFHSNKPALICFFFARFNSIQFKLLFIFHPVWYINVDCHRFEECTYHKYNEFQTLRTLGLPCTSFCLFVCFLFYIKINHIEIEQRVPTRRWKSSFIGTQAIGIITIVIWCTICYLHKQHTEIHTSLAIIYWIL